MEMRDIVSKLDDVVVQLRRIANALEDNNLDENVTVMVVTCESCGCRLIPEDHLICDICGAQMPKEEINDSGK